MPYWKVLIFTLAIFGGFEVFSKSKNKKCSQQFSASSFINKLTQRAQQGMMDAQYELGSAFYDGYINHRNQSISVKKNFEQAYRWFKKAAEKGHTLAEFSLGSMYLEGMGVPVDITQSRFWFKKAAEKGVVDAMYNMAVTYHKLQPIPDREQAIYWYSKGVKLGDANSTLNLGLLYQVGDANNKPDFDKAREIYLKAAKKDKDIQLNLSVLEFLSGNMAEAFKWVLSVAKGGDHVAQYNLAVMLLRGLGAGENPKQAFVWMKEASRALPKYTDYGEKIHTLAKYSLGVMTRDGLGVNPNPELGEKLMAEALAGGKTINQEEVLQVTFYDR